VQEFIVAREVQIVCGEDVLDFETIADLQMNLPHRGLYHDDAAELGDRLVSELASFSQDDKLINGPFNSIWRQREDWRIPSRHVRNTPEEKAEREMRSLLDFSRNDCTNPLDHIYGFLHLAEHVGRAVIPDYRKSSFELAMQCLEHLPSDTLLWARRLLGALRLDSAQPEIRKILDARRRTFLQSCKGQEPELPRQWNNFPLAVESQDSVVQNSEIAILRFRTSFTKRSRFDALLPTESGWLKIQKVTGDRLTGTLILGHSILSHVDIKEFEQAACARAAKFAESWTRHMELYGSDMKPRELFFNDMLVGLLCCRAESGDYILRTDDEVLCDGDKFRVCLIVRRHFNPYFKIIGQALVSSDWAFCAGEATEADCHCGLGHLHSWPRPDRHWYGAAKPRFTTPYLNEFNLYLSKDDVVAFASHDLMGNRIETGFHELAVKDLPLVPRHPWAPLQRLQTNITSEAFSSYAIGQRPLEQRGQPMWSGSWGLDDLEKKSPSGPRYMSKSVAEMIV
jgi:hypothetical protein